MKESMKIDVLSIVLYDLRHPRTFVATFLHVNQVLALNLFQLIMQSISAKVH